MTSTNAEFPAVEIDCLAAVSGMFRLEVKDIIVRRGARVAIVGKNGSGKTSLIEALLGIRQVTTGRARILGIAIQQWHRQAVLRRRLGVQLQQGLYPTRLTPGELVELHRVAFCNADIEVYEALQIGTLQQIAYRDLSHGQRQRLNLYMAMGHRPELLVLDEPTAALDQRFVGAVLDQLRRHASKTVLMICHTPDELALADEVIWLDGGTVHWHRDIACAISEAVGAYVGRLVLSTQERREWWASKLSQEKSVRFVDRVGQRELHVMGEAEVRRILDAVAGQSECEECEVANTGVSELLRWCARGR
jgi:ABC-2 type transport system ATP-binding protein